MSSKWFRIWIVVAVLWIGGVAFLNLDYLTQVVRFEIGWRKGLEKQAKDHPEMKVPKGFLLKELSDPVYRSMGLYTDVER